ncbi:GNAT family N-acetyltransferase [Streptomyces sp. NPDC004549]|uniref:GNAT family N-acetyltransferase n=1 Tax=Streptomyces sp. NPDC004549 TaxID=3154283 RepID=UPI0033AF2D63
MAAEGGGLPEEGLSLWLTEWKVSARNPWLGRRVVAAIGGRAAGRIDYVLHPDGQALKVAMLEVLPDFQRRGLAGVMMDALYAAYPTAWINHGWRTKRGAFWWNGYAEPAPQRNVHNRPPAEWAAYFNAVDVAADMAHNAHQNKTYDLDGHREVVYRYGERLETEAALHAASFRPATPVRVDPGAQPLHGQGQLVLPPAVHDFVHDRAQDPRKRATALLEFVGHGNLPRRTHWNTTRQAAFADAYHEYLFDSRLPERPVTQVVFTLAPLDTPALSVATALESSVDFDVAGEVAVGVSQMSWRQAGQSHLTHSAEFASAVPAAIAPLSVRHASEAYRDRYDGGGFLRAGTREPARQPFADRAAQIRALAERLLRGQAARAQAQRSPSAMPQTAASPPPVPEQQPPQPGHRM